MNGTTNDWKNRTVGDIVAENFAASRVFASYGIDFCCHGGQTLAEACRKDNLSEEKVIGDLCRLKEGSRSASPEFAEWPLDLLIDYVLKIHHRGIRRRGPEIARLLDKVVAAHAEVHPELHELQALFAQSLEDLESHLQKEENVLFPFLNELFTASEEGYAIRQMHCGTVQNPIRVMFMEHEGEGNRYHRITELTGNFQTPADGCASYRLLMEELKGFMTALYEHIHLENNLIFPRAVALESQWVR